jgi:hypothetical protein
MFQISGKRDTSRGYVAVPTLSMIVPKHPRRMLTERERLMLRLDLILYMRLLKMMRVQR